MARAKKYYDPPTCDQCGKPIPKHKSKYWPHQDWSPRYDTKFCSNACRQKAYRIRRRVARANQARKP